MMKKRKAQPTGGTNKIDPFEQSVAPITFGEETLSREFPSENQSVPTKESSSPPPANEGKENRQVSKNQVVTPKRAANKRGKKMPAAISYPYVSLNIKLKEIIRDAIYAMATREKKSMASYIQGMVLEKISLLKDAGKVKLSAEFEDYLKLEIRKKEKMKNRMGLIENLDDDLGV